MNFFSYKVTWLPKHVNGNFRALQRSLSMDILWNYINLFGNLDLVDKQSTEEQRRHTVMVLASHQYDPIPRIGDICGLSLLLVLVLAPRGFSPRVLRYSGFLVSSQTNISKFKFDLDACQALYQDPLARISVEDNLIPCFDINK